MKIPYNKIHNFIVFEIIDQNGNIFKNENLPLIDWAKENNFSYTSLDKLRKDREDVAVPYKFWKLKKLYTKNKHFQKDDSYLYILFNLNKPGKYIYMDMEFNYEPFYIGSGTYNRIFDYNEENIVNKSIFSEKYNLIRELYKSFKLTDFVYIFKISKDKKEIDELEKLFIQSIGRTIDNTGPLLNTLDGDIFSNNEIAIKYNAERNTPEFLEHLSKMVKEKQWSGASGDIRRLEHSKKLKEVNPSRKHYFLRLMDGSRFYIFGSLRQWCKENDFGLESLRNYENTGIIEKSSIKDHSFNSPKKAKLLGGEFFSYTQLEFSNLEITLLNNIKNEFDIKD